MTGPPEPAAVLRDYATAIDTQDWPRLRATLADDFTSHLVRTGEHLGADDYVAFNRDYPGRWRFRLEDVVVADDRVAGRAHVSDGPDVFHVALFGSVRDGTLLALDELWTEDHTSDPTSDHTDPPTTAGDAP